MSKNYADIKNIRKPKSYSREDIYSLVGSLFKMTEREYLGYCLIKADALKMILSKINTNLPKEIEDAKSIVNRGETIVNQAKADAKSIKAKAENEYNTTIQLAKNQADVIINQAQAQADSMVAEDVIYLRAKAEAENMINNANAEILNAQDQFNAYALDILNSLSALTGSFQESVAESLENLKRDMEEIGEINVNTPAETLGQAAPVSYEEEEEEESGDYEEDEEFGEGEDEEEDDYDEDDEEYEEEDEEDRK